MSKTITLPRLIDCHVHFREPGLTHKATMASEAASAWAGGVGTVCEMPNTIPATTSIAALADKIRRVEIAKSEKRMPKDFDMRFFFGATEMAHIFALHEMLAGSSEELQRLRARCCGLKLYFDHSTGNQKASEEVIEEAFQLCAKYHFPLVGHCEDAQMNSEARKANSEDGDISLHSKNRPAKSEEKAIEHVIKLMEKYPAAFHIAHLSTKLGLELVRKAKRKNLPITCEVAPHHLFLTVDDYQSLGTLAKMNPPLRSHEDQEALWEGIADGTVDCISTDHAPHTLSEKTETHGSPLEAPSGVPGVETMLPLLLTVAAGGWPHPHQKKPHAATLSTDDIARLCFTNPNRIFKLEKDPKADQIEVDLDTEWVIRASELHSKCGWTPYEGWRVCGKIRA